MKGFFLPGDTLAPRVPCRILGTGDPRGWCKLYGAQALGVVFYEGKELAKPPFTTEGTLFREDSGPRWYAGTLWCRAGGHKYRITYDETERQFYAERILPASPECKRIRYETGGHPPCVAR